MDVKNKIIHQAKKRINILIGGLVLVVTVLSCFVSVHIFQHILKTVNNKAWCWENDLQRDYRLLAELWGIEFLIIIIFFILCKVFIRNLSRTLDQLSNSDLRKYEPMYEKLPFVEKICPSIIPSSKKLFITKGMILLPKTIAIPYSEIQEFAEATGWISWLKPRRGDSYFLQIDRKDGTRINFIKSTGAGLYPLWQIYKEKKPFPSLVLPWSLIKRFERYDAS